MPGRTTRSPAAAATQAMTVLRARVTAGNIPTAVQMLGFDITGLGRAGRARATSTRSPPKEGWDKVVPGGAAEVLEV